MWRKDDVLANPDWGGDPPPGSTLALAARHLSRQPSQHQRGIGAAEAERVGEHGIDAALLRLVRHEIDGGLDRWMVEVERRWSDVVADGEHRIDRLHGARRSEQVPNGRFGRRHGEL